MKKIHIKTLFFVGIFFAAVMVPLASQQRKPSGSEYWYILKQAQDAYDYGEYGKSVTLAEEAKSVRSQQTAWEEYTLEQAQKMTSVRRAGDSLLTLVPALKQAGQNNAVEVVQAYLEEYGSAYFGDSFARLMLFLKNNSVYPEADYLIGKVYRLEGENEQAMAYMKKAYDAAELLNVPGMRYDILYDMADIAKSQLQEKEYASYVAHTSNSKYYTDYEKYMLDILADDKQFTNSAYMSSLLHLIQNNNKNSVKNFFVFYRSTNDTSLKALEGLTSYYTLSGNAMTDEAKIASERIKALKCAALGSVIAVTRIQDILEDRLTGYSYVDLADLLSKSAKYTDVVEWGSTNGVWELFYTLAQVSADCGYTVFAKDLLTVLKTSEPEFYWRQKAAHNPLLQNDTPSEGDVSPMVITVAE